MKIQVMGQTAAPKKRPIFTILKTPLKNERTGLFFFLFLTGGASLTPERTVCRMVIAGSLYLLNVDIF